jgi:hypothetical protein
MVEWDPRGPVGLRDQTARCVWGQNPLPQHTIQIEPVPGVDSKRVRPTAESWQATIVVSSYQIKNVLNVTALVTRAVVNCWDG